MYNNFFKTQDDYDWFEASADIHSITDCELLCELYETRIANLMERIVKLEKQKIALEVISKHMTTQDTIGRQEEIQ